MVSQIRFQNLGGAGLPVCYHVRRFIIDDQSDLSIFTMAGSDLSKGTNGGMVHAGFPFISPHTAADLLVARKNDRPIHPRGSADLRHSDGAASDGYSFFPGGRIYGNSLDRHSGQCGANCVSGVFLAAGSKHENGKPGVIIEI